MKIKSFKQFLNEFEIDGELNSEKMYIGIIDEIITQFESDMISKFGAKNQLSYDGDAYGIFVNSEFGTTEDAIFSSYGVSSAKQLNHVLIVNISSTLNRTNYLEVIEKLKKLKLDNYIEKTTEQGDSDGKYYLTQLQIPIVITK